MVHVGPDVTCTCVLGTFEDAFIPPVPVAVAVPAAVTPGSCAAAATVADATDTRKLQSRPEAVDIGVASSSPTVGVDLIVRVPVLANPFFTFIDPYG